MWTAPHDYPLVKMRNVGRCYTGICGNLPPPPSSFNANIVQFSGDAVAAARDRHLYVVLAAGAESPCAVVGQIAIAADRDAVDKS